MAVDGAKELCESYIDGYRTTRSSLGRHGKTKDVCARLYAESEERRNRHEARRSAALTARNASEEVAGRVRQKVVREEDARRTVARLYEDALHARARQAEERARARLALEALREGTWETTFRPRVSSASVELASYARGARLPVEERLYAEGARRLEARRQATMEAERRAVRDATPRITQRAAALQGRGDWARRLHVEAKLLAAKKQRPASARRADGRGEHKTRHRAQSHAYLQFSDTLRSDDGREEQRTQRAPEARAEALFRDAYRREEALRRLRDQALRDLDTHTKVAVSKRSEKLAAKQKTTPADRLTGKDDRTRSRLLANIVAAHNDAEAERLRCVATLERRRANRHEQLYGDAKRHADRRKAKRIQSSLQQLEGCTFAPNLATHSTRGLQVEGDIAARNDDWAHKRQLKIKSLLEAKQQAEIEGCTFAPTIPPPPAVGRPRSPALRRDSSIRVPRSSHPLDAAPPPAPADSPLSISQFEAALDCAYADRSSSKGSPSAVPAAPNGSPAYQTRGPMAAALTPRSAPS